MPGAVFIEGDRVNLRTIEEEDLEFIRDSFNHPEVRLRLDVDRPQNLEQEREFFENVVCDEEEVHLAVSVDEEMVGMVSLREAEESIGDIGLWIAPEFQGNGYGTEASQLIIEHAFDHLRYHKIKARAYVDNQASRRIWEKLGFEQEGRLREHVYRDGEYQDLIVYGILEQEWES